jgi:hypothetical protein
MQDESRTDLRFMAKEDITGDAEVRNEIKILINNRDPKILTYLWGKPENRSPIDSDLPFFILEGPTQNLEEGGFASPVFSYETVDFGGIDIQIHMVQSSDTWEILGYPCHL